MQVAILYNTVSAKGKGRRIANQIASFCKQHSFSYQFFENDWSQGTKNVKLIALVGGDGTMNFFINHFPNVDIPILFFPGGTGNDFFWKLYGKKSVHNCLQLLFNFCNDGSSRLKEVDVASCVISQNVKYFYVNSVGLGFDGEVLKSMNAIRFWGGFLGYYLVVLRNIFSFKEPLYTLHINDEPPLKSPYTIINIANSSRTGGGFLISPHAEIDDQQLNLLYTYVPSVVRRLRLLLKVGSGNHIKEKVVHYQEVKQVNIQTPEPIFAQIDGELIQSDKFEITLSNKKLKMLV